MATQKHFESVLRPELRLYGPPQLVTETGSIPIFDRAAQLIGLLALCDEGILRRSKVAETLWGDVQSGLVNLRQTLKRIKNGPSIVAGILVVDGTHLRLDTDACEIDVLQDPSLSPRVDIPLGEFLDGVTAPSNAFEDWLRNARVELFDRRRQQARAAISQALRYGRCEISQLEKLANQLRVFDDGNGQVEATIEGAMRTVAGGINLIAARATEPLSRVEPAQVPRLAFLKPSGGAVGPIPIERFVEDVADRLSRFRTFATLATYSSFAISRKDIEASARRRNVSFIVETRAVDGMRDPYLAVRLVRMNDSSIVWATEIPLRSDMLQWDACRFAQTCAATLAEQVEADLALKAQSNSEPSAYLHYLNGRGQQLRGDLPAMRRARNSFQAAIRVEPRFAVARARIAETLVVEWILRGGTDGMLLNKAYDQAILAREHDPSAAEAHWILGSAQLYRREYEPVARHFETAEMLAPHSADLVLNHADAMSLLGELDRSEVLFRRSLDLNPTPPNRYWWFGASIALSRGDFGVAADRCDLIDSDEVAVGTRTACYALSGQIEKAGLWANRLREVLPGISVEDLAGLMPGPADSALQENYKEGLRIAGL